MLGIMARITKSGVLFKAVLLMILCAAAVTAPLITHRLKNISAQREFKLADEPTQARIVRAYLGDQLQDIRLGKSFTDALYFERASAVLRSSDSELPWDQFESRSVDRDATLERAAGDPTTPLELRQLLARATLEQTYNTNPEMEGVAFVALRSEIPFDGKSCQPAPAPNPRLVRISRAPVHGPSEMAIALVDSVFCDGSTGLEVVRFNSQGGIWRVDKSHLKLP